VWACEGKGTHSAPSESSWALWYSYWFPSGSLNRHCAIFDHCAVTATCRLTTPAIFRQPSILRNLIRPPEPEGQFCDPSRRPGRDVIWPCFGREQDPTSPNWAQRMPSAGALSDRCRWGSVQRSETRRARQAQQIYGARANAGSAEWREYEPAERCGSMRCVSTKMG